MTSINTVPNDVLPASVPKLEVSGGNWAIFALRFKTVIQGKGLWGHFDGTTPCPQPSSPTPAQATPATPAATGVAATSTGTGTTSSSTSTPITTQVGLPSTSSLTAEELAELIAIWNRNENIARSLLAQRIPDSTLVVVAEHENTKAMWDAIVADFTYKSTMSQNRLHRDFMSSRVPDKGDVRLYLNNLRARKAELVAHWLSTFASNQLTAARLMGARSVDPEILITVLCDEWERTRPMRKGPKPGTGGDDALAVEGGSNSKDKGSGKGKGGGKGKQRKRGPCWTCGGEHWKKDCPNKDKKSDGGSGGKGEEKVNAAEEEDSALMIEVLSDDESEAGDLFEMIVGVEGEFAIEYMCYTHR